MILRRQRDESTGGSLHTHWFFLYIINVAHLLSTIHVLFCQTIRFVQDPTNTPLAASGDPNTYMSYLEMAEEFRQLLHYNVWVMDS